MNNAFTKLHPLTGLLYFIAVIGFSMFIMNPVCIAVSLLCALINAAIINGRRTMLFSLKYVLPMILLVVTINPVFNHRGATIISYLPWNNPLTLESIVYGAAAALMFASVMLWFSVFNTVMTSDKIICLFGRIIPSLSLVISMTLRFVPRFTEQFRQIKKAEIIPKKQGLTVRLKALIRNLSVMISWSLESSVETADSMKSRGYGLKGRTAYNIFKFRKPDVFWLTVIVILSAMIITLAVFNMNNYSFFPSFRLNFNGFKSMVFYAIYSALMIIPAVINIGEGLKWKRLRSAI